MTKHGLSRLNGRETKRIREELLSKFPEICAMCNKTPKELGVDKLELHEWKYKRPPDCNNFIWLCHGCNHKKPLRKEALLGREATPEFLVSHEKKPLFRNWLVGEILKPENNHHIPLWIVIAQGSYEIGVDVATIKRWLQALVNHPTAPYMIRPGEGGKDQVWESGYEPKDEDM